MSDGLHDSLDARHKKGWENVQSDCMLCRMEKKTEWHIETQNFVIAEKLSGGPFIVSKKHEKQLSDERRERAEHLVSLLYDEFELEIIMSHCENHWHAHIITGNTDPDLSDE